MSVLARHIRFLRPLFVWIPESGGERPAGVMLQLPPAGHPLFEGGAG